MPRSEGRNASSTMPRTERPCPGQLCAGKGTVLYPMWRSTKHMTVAAQPTISTRIFTTAIPLTTTV
ncbi:MAG: hypothetical protein MZV64_23155 [Ignavibacteriales bacterium]|nr:hypothetical protein [Ignavibacteriales bacterium]